MTDDELDFFRRLCAPFPESALGHVPKGGRTLTYCKARALMNRLDDVAGPGGWYPEYRQTERGYTCKLSIRVPDPCPLGDLTTMKWIAKEDGGGFEGMGQKNRATGEFESDDDNDEKSAYTNAFRRACAAWGLARYLYREGVPAYLGTAPAVPDAPARHEPAATPPPRPIPPGEQERLTPSSGPRRPSPPPAQADDAPPPRRQGGYDNFQVPPPGKAAFAWAKKMEEHFKNSGVVKRMNAIARDFGYEDKITDLPAVAVTEVCWAMIDELKTWDAYRGEFDHLEDPRPNS